MRAFPPADRTREKLPRIGRPVVAGDLPQRGKRSLGPGQRRSQSRGLPTLREKCHSRMHHDRKSPREKREQSKDDPGRAARGWNDRRGGHGTVPAGGSCGPCLHALVHREGVHGQTASRENGWNPCCT